MAKTPKISPGPRGASTGGQYQSVGRTAEGINVLKPATRPKHFTTNQIRSTISKILKTPPESQAS